MDELIKIRDVSARYAVSARTRRHHIFPGVPLWGPGRFFAAGRGARLEGLSRRRTDVRRDFAFAGEGDNETPSRTITMIAQGQQE